MRHTQSYASSTEGPKTKVKKHDKIKIFGDYEKHLHNLKTDFFEKFGCIETTRCEKSEFEFIATVGCGSFGQVFLARHTQFKKYCAVKVISKESVVTKHLLEHLLLEKNLLQAIKFPFIVPIENFFQDNSNIFYVMPYFPAGDFYGHLSKMKTLKEKDAKFYAAQVVLAIEFLHKLTIIYRDLKPENIVLDYNGYIKLIDFGLCKIVEGKTYTVCGTPEYLAPEIILYKGYGKSVDWWSFGVFVFEIIAGYTPFYANNHIKIYEKITAGKVVFPKKFSNDIQSLISSVLQIDVTKRFGNLKNGSWDIKNHKWFDAINWQAVYTRKIVAPYIPKYRDAGDTSNFEVSDVRIIESVHEKYPAIFADF